MIHLLNDYAVVQKELPIESLYHYFLIQGLSNPSFVKPTCISGQLINNFHNKPLLWFSIITGIGPWSMAKYFKGYQL
jgi:hypothetical protein